VLWFVVGASKGSREVTVKQETALLS